MTKELFPAPILVLGVGNLLMSDEGFGVRVVEELQKGSDLPRHVEIIDGGTAGHDLIDIIEKRTKIIIIDAVDGGCEPGSIYRFTPADLQNGSTYDMTSLHQIGILEILNYAHLFGQAPQETVILGIQPLSLELKIGLSPKIEAQIPKMMELVLKEIN